MASSSSVALATIDSNSFVNIIPDIPHRINNSISDQRRRRRRRSEAKLRVPSRRFASVTIDMFSPLSSSSLLLHRTSISEVRPYKSITSMASSSPSSSTTMNKNKNRNTKHTSHQKASDLQSKFGSDALRFLDIGGVTVLEVKLRSTGSNIRLLLHEARITSFKFKMWHGGLEEFLQTEVTDNPLWKPTNKTYNSTVSLKENPIATNADNPSITSDQSSASTNRNSYINTGDSIMSKKISVPINYSPDSSKFLVSGGMSPRFCFLSNHGDSNENSHYEDDDLANDDQNVLYWHFESVKEEADQYIQITLRCDGKDGDFYIQDVITLSKTMLASAILIANKGKKPMIFTGSISSRLCIRSAEAVHVVGLQGCRYYSPRETAKKMNSKNDKDKNSLFGKLKKLVWQRIPENEDVHKIKSSAEDEIPVNIKQEESDWFIEKQDNLILVDNGISKLYQSPPKKFRVSDEGFRRSLVIDRYGFRDVELDSPEVDGGKPYLSIGCSSSLSPIVLSPNGTWKGAQVLVPDS